MLDLDKIRKQFNEILYSFTKEDLENWLKFAREREERERLEELNEEESIEMAKKIKSNSSILDKNIQSSLLLRIKVNR